MTTVKQVQAHIGSLISQDKQDGKQVDSFYDQALSIIKSSIQAFFVQYSNDTGLDINTVSQQANSWDMQQFENAINLMMFNIKPNGDLNRRLIAARATASGNSNKRDILSSIIAATIAIATFQTQQYGNQSLKQSYIKEYNYLSPDSQMDEGQLPKDVQKQSDFNNRVWIHGDLSVNRTQSTLDKALKKTIDKPALRQLLKDNQNKPKANNLDSAAQTGISFNKQLLKFSSISNNNQAKMTVYKNDDNTDYVKWITENDDRVCNKCQPKDGKVYELSDAPVPQESTHLNCRCSLQRCDADGNLL